MLRDRYTQYFWKNFYLNWTTDAVQSLSKFQKDFFYFCKYWQTDYKIYMKNQRAQTIPNILIKRNKVEGLPFPDWMNSYKAIVIKCIELM